MHYPGITSLMLRAASLSSRRLGDGDRPPPSLRTDSARTTGSGRPESRGPTGRPPGRHPEASRGESAGPRLPTESLRGWTRRLAGDRTRASLIALPLSGDVPDPMGGRPRDYERARDDLAAMTDRLGVLLAP